MKSNGFEHSVKVPRFYKITAKTVQNVEEEGASLKQLVYEKKHPVSNFATWPHPRAQKILQNFNNFYKVLQKFSRRTLQISSLNFVFFYSYLPMVYRLEVIIFVNCELLLKMFVL